jgi:transcription elongation factor Elf1
MSDQPTDMAIVPQHQQTAVTRPQDNAMAVADILQQVRLIQDVMAKVMQEGVHYGTVPGCGDRKTLLQPGAQKLTMTFRLAPEYHIQETNHERGHKEYRVICTLKSIQSGNFVGQGVGCCTTLEGKYRWKGGARKCPECGKETIIKGKAEYGGGWLCFAKKGGCGAKWEDGAKVIESQSVEKVEHDSPADYYNTVLKMAKKRAFVDATITATASSDFLTQDIGDDDGPPADDHPPKRPAERPAAPTPQRPAQAAKPAPAPQAATAAKAPATPAKVTSEEEWASFLAACKARLLTLITPDDEWAWWKYGTDAAWILPNESLADAQPAKMFEGFDRANFKESVKSLAEKHRGAVYAMASNCPPEFMEEVQRGFVAMPLPPATPPAKPAPTPKAVGCPACNSTAITKHEDLIGVVWCKSCGTQWQEADPNKEDYEEHEWMFAKLPFAPKDAAKKTYKGKTLGQLARLDNKYWFGVVKNFTAEPYQGRPPSAESVKFAAACEEARKHMDAEKTTTEREAIDPKGPDNDDVPF